MPPFSRPLALALLLHACAAAGGQSPATPAQQVHTLYQWLLQPSPAEQGHPDTGRPYQPVRDLFGPALLRALDTQQAYETACARIAPGTDKPHMLDQSPFFYWPDKATLLVSTTETIRGQRARVATRLAIDDHEWTDQVVLHQQPDGRWVIVDILWQDGGSLTARLQAFASERCTAAP